MGAKSRRREGRGGEEAGGGRLLAAAPGVLICVLTLYFFVFVLDLLDVTVDDGSGLVKAYEEIRDNNLRTQREEAERMAVAERKRFIAALQDYQGDPPAAKNALDSVNPVTAIAQKQPHAEEAELEAELEAAIYRYITEFGDRIEESAEVTQLMNAKNPVLTKLRKRQAFVEERFDAVSSMPASMRPRDYVYRSVFDDAATARALALPPTPAPPPGGIGSWISSLVGGGKKPAAAAPRNPAQEAGDDQVEPAVKAMRESGSFAALSGSSKAGAAVEHELTSLGYVRHGAQDQGLPLWLVAFGKRCPSAKALAAKEGGDGPVRHLLLCAASNPQLGRRGLMKRESSTPDSAVGFFRLYDEDDREAILAQEPDANQLYVVLQHNGASKAQFVRNLRGLVTNERYHDASLGLIAAALPSDHGAAVDGRPASLRAHVVLVNGKLKAFEVDVLVGRDGNATIPGLAPPLSAEARPLAVAGDPATLRSAVRAAVLPALRGWHPPPPRPSTVVVEHVCFDLVLNSAATEPRLLTISSECPLEQTSPAARSAVVHGALVAAEQAIVSL